MLAPEPGHRAGPLPAPIGSPLSWLYRASIRRINRRFDRGRGVVTFDRPVISVGNLSVGGTGKTPMVRQIVGWLLEAGHRPCIAMRGYGGGGGASDEAAAYSREFPDVPVVAQANRTLGLIQLFSCEHERDAAHSDCIVLDDGFQHRQIARNLDIVLVDASRSPFEDRLLPAGWLREPVTSIARASAVVITHAERVQPADVTELHVRLAAIRTGGGADAVCRHAWTGLLSRNAGHDQRLGVASLGGQRVMAICAIGNPGPFLATAENAAGGALAATIVLRDHDRFSDATVRRIIDTARACAASAMVTTEKDWSKLARVPDSMWPCAVYRPVLELMFDRGAAALRTMVLVAAGDVASGEAPRDPSHQDMGFAPDGSIPRSQP